LQTDLTIVVGHHTSSNSNRLREVATNRGVNAHLVNCADDVKPEWLEGVKRVSLTAGASTPEDIVQGVIDKLMAYGVSSVEEVVDVEENVNWKLPRNLQKIVNEQNKEGAGEMKETVQA